MSDLINDLLQLAGVSRVSTRRELLSMTGLAKAVVSDLRKGEPCRNLAIEIADGISAFGDARLVKIVLVNLLGNAWKFTSKRSDARIAFGCESKLGEAVFFARDNGAGRLFSPFQRLHTRDEFEGTGIGLAIVQRIVSRHGGRIWVEAAPEKGATFYFTLGKTR
jgi:light-regulated signal transduction histidine kinase (bacteriophytochrome)